MTLKDLSYKLEEYKGLGDALKITIAFAALVLGRGLIFIL